MKPSTSFAQVIVAYWAECVALATGIVGFVVAFGFAVPQTPDAVIAHWLTSFVCLIVGALSVLYKMHKRAITAEKAVAEPGQSVALMQERRRLAQELLSKADERTVRFLRELLVTGGMNGDQVERQYPGLNICTIPELGTFLGGGAGLWFIDPAWVLVLSDLLLATSAAGPGAVSQLVSRLCGWSDVLQRAVTAFNASWEAMRRDKGRRRKP